MKKISSLTHVIVFSAFLIWPWPLLSLDNRTRDEKLFLQESIKAHCPELLSRPEWQEFLTWTTVNGSRSPEFQQRFKALAGTDAAAPQLQRLLREMKRHDRSLLSPLTAAQDVAQSNNYQLSSITNQQAVDVILPDFQVNENKGGSCDQDDPAIACDGLGNFVVVWEDKRNSWPENWNIYCQRFTASANRIGTTFKVNDDAGFAAQYSPEIAMDGDGNFAIVWQDKRNNVSDLYVQLYRYNGTKIGSNFKVNEVAGETGYYLYLDIAMDSNGNFVVTWQNGQSAAYNIFAQRYDENGNAIGGNFRVNDVEGSIAVAVFGPAVAMDSDGNFIATWQDRRNGDDDIYAQRYGNNGSAIGANFKVNDDAGGIIQYNPDIAMDSVGSFVITWEDFRNRGSNIFAQRYNASGSVIGGNFQINEELGGNGAPDIAINYRGDFVITWDIHKAQVADRIYAQRFDFSGNKIGGNFQVADNNDPAIAMDAKCNFIITWASADIWAQRYNSDGAPIGSNFKVNNDDGSARQEYPAIAMDNNGNFVITWGDDRNRWQGDIFAQRYGSSGSKIGSNFKVNDDTESDGNWDPAISKRSNGDFVITWVDDRNYDPDIYAQRYSSSGSKNGNNFMVMTYGDDGLRQPAIATDSDGSFVITCIDYFHDPTMPYSDFIRAQRFSSSGEKMGDELHVQHYGDVMVDNCDIAMDNNGNFVITWDDDSEGTRNIYVQRFNSSGTKIGAEFKVSDAHGESPAIGMHGNGEFIITWADRRNGNADIYAQRYNSSGAAIGGNYKVNDDIGSTHQFNPTLSVDNNGDFVIAWEDERNGNPDIYAQCYKSNGSKAGGNFRVNQDSGSSRQQEPDVVLSSGLIVTTWQDNRVEGQAWDIFANVMSFAGGAMPAPVLLDPVPDKQGVGAKLWLDWQSSIGAESYNLQVDDNSNFSSPVFSQSAITATNCVVSGLNYTTDYFWRIRANGATVNSNWTFGRRFTTMAMPSVIIDQPNYYVPAYLTDGDQYFIDRIFTVSSVPADLRNLLWIKTANNDKNNSGTSLISLQLLQEATVYVAYDHRASSVPTWLSSEFQQTSYEINISDEASPFEVWSKQYAPGTYELGGNMAAGAAGSGCNYLVLLRTQDNPFFVFKEEPASMTPVYNSIASWGDYDADGDLDILLMGMGADGTPASRIYRNDDMTFTDIGAALPGVHEGAAAWGDYDNDNDLEILITGKGVDGVPVSHIIRNQGIDNFVDSEILLTGLTYSSAAWVDYDNDGDLDAYLTGNDAGNQRYSRMYVNVGGTFTSVTLPIDAVAFGSAAWGDYDHDGDHDLMLSGRIADNSRIMKLYDNTGQGQLQESGVVLPGLSSSAIAWGDYDNDGDLDLIATGKNSAEQAVTVLYRNDGAHTFAEVATPFPGVLSSTVAWGDYDNDGNADILIAGRNSGKTTEIFRNNNGTFEQIPFAFAGIDNGCAAWGDCDGDGDLDVLLTGQDAGDDGVVKVYRNNILKSNTPPTAPGELNYAFVDGDSTVTLSWGMGTDSETAQSGLTYNLRVGTSPGGSEIVSAMAMATGKKELSGSGNAGHNLQWTLYHLESGTYYWSVQSVDNGFAASEFAEEQIFISVPVPVELSSFRASAEDKQVRLEWDTATETANLGFNIYCSTEKESLGEKVNTAIIAGSGTTTRMQHYQFIDRPALAGVTLYYRLEQVDFDGEKTCSQPLQVFLAGPTKFELLQNYPNPFNSSTTIAFSVPAGKSASRVELVIYDIQGHRVITLTDGVMQGGTHRVTWDGTSEQGMPVTSGIYYCQLKCERFNDVKKVILLK